MPPPTCGWVGKSCEPALATASRATRFCRYVHTCTPRQALQRGPKSKTSFGCESALRARDPTFRPQNWAAPGRAHSVHPPGALCPPNCAGSVEGHLQVVHSLAGRVLGVRGRHDGTEVMEPVLSCSRVHPSFPARERSPRDTASATLALDSTRANCGIQPRRAAVPQKAANMPLTKASLPYPFFSAASPAVLSMKAIQSAGSRPASVKRAMSWASWSVVWCHGQRRPSGQSAPHIPSHCRPGRVRAKAGPAGRSLLCAGVLLS